MTELNVFGWTVGGVKAHLLKGGSKLTLCGNWVCYVRTSRLHLDSEPVCGTCVYSYRLRQGNAKRTRGLASR